MTEGGAARVLLVDAPSRFRDSVVRAVVARGADARTADDGLSVLAEIDSLAPNVVVVGDTAGPPGADSLCRILERRFEAARVLRLGQAGQAGLSDRKGQAFVPRSLPASLLAARILSVESPVADSAGFQVQAGAFQVVQVFLALCQRRSTGRLYVEAEGAERRFDLAWGLPVASAGGGLDERLGAIAREQGGLSPAQVEQGLDLAHSGGMRLGEAFREQGVVDAAKLFELLGQQHMRRLAEAVVAGPATVRFVPIALEDLAGSIVMTPVHPLTGLLQALARAGADARTAILSRLASRQLVRAGDGAQVQRMLRGFSLPETAVSVDNPTTVDALRRTLEAELASGHDSDSLTLALIASGVVVPGRGVAASSSPPGGSDRLRVLRGLSQLEVPGDCGTSAAPSSEWEHALEAYFYGKQAEQPASWVDGVFVDAQADSPAICLYLDVLGARGPHACIAADTHLSVRELRLALHARLDTIDRLFPPSSESPRKRVLRMQLRAAVEQAGDRLPTMLEEAQAAPTERLSDAPELQLESDLPPPILEAASDPEPVVPKPQTTPSVPASAGTAGATSKKPPPPPPQALEVSSVRQDESQAPASSAITPEVESMVRQTRWSDLIEHVEGGGVAIEALPPSIAFLYAIALKEVQGASVSQGSPDLLGIRAVARLLGVGASSPAALVIAKRALRTRPLAWSKQPTPKVSITAVVVALLIGAGVGLLVHSLSLF
ncbi:MAG: hypothetical protein OXR73_26120 [Myxococcales bacterium]|nr:hypothetical protein [Myxococcales bacterium]